MNGSVPSGSTHEFLTTVKPLVQQLLQKRERGNLRQIFSNLQAQRSLLLPKEFDLGLVISKSEVELMDTSVALGVLKRLIESPITAREFVERVDISFNGYDHTQQELFEIPEVRKFVYLLDEQFPFWLYFLSKRHFGLQCLLLCFIPPFLTDDVRPRIFREQINQLLINRWFPAMNYICEYVWFSEKQVE